MGKNDPMARWRADLSVLDAPACTRIARRAIAGGLGIVTLAIAAACAAGDRDPPPPHPDGAVTYTVTPSMLVSGREIYLRECAPCHGLEGKGDGPSAAVLEPKPRDHSDGAYMDKLTDQRIAHTVSLGGVIAGYPNMPSIRHIAGDDMVALIAHVRTLGHPEGVETVTINPEE